MFCKTFHHTICFGFFFRVSSFVLFLYHRSVATPFFYNLVIFCAGIGSFHREVSSFLCGPLPNV